MAFESLCWKYSLLYIIFSFIIGCKEKQSPLDKFASGSEPKILGKGSLSVNSMQWNNVFISESENIYFTKSLPSGPVIQKMTVDKNSFGELQSIPLPLSGMHTDIFVNKDENLLLFSSTMPESATDTIFDWNIWKCSKINSEWESPKLFFQEHLEGDQFYPWLTDNGSIYFSSRPAGSQNADLYCSKSENGVYEYFTALPDHINSNYLEGDAFVAKDESYMIFAGFNRSESLGKSDLYISFNKKGIWSPPVWLGEEINSTGFDGSPFITDDEKYLLFTSSRESKEDSTFFNHYVVKFNPEDFDPNK